MGRGLNQAPILDTGQGGLPVPGGQGLARQVRMLRRASTRRWYRSPVIITGKRSREAISMEPPPTDRPWAVRISPPRPFRWKRTLLG